MASADLRRAIALVVILVGATGCSQVAFKQEHSPETSFDGYRTFSWLIVEDPREAQSKDALPVIVEKVDRAIQEQLEAKGMELTADRGDLLVNWFVGSERKLDINTYSHGWGLYGWYAGSTTSVREWTEGTLVIDLVDSGSKELVWRGWALGAVDVEATPEKVTERIAEIVAGILERYPPNQS